MIDENPSKRPQIMITSSTIDKKRYTDSIFLDLEGIFQPQNNNVPFNDRRPRRTREPFAFCTQPGQDDQQSQSALQPQVDFFLGIKLT